MMACGRNAARRRRFAPLSAASSVPHAIHSRTISLFDLAAFASRVAIGSPSAPAAIPAFMMPTWLKVSSYRRPKRGSSTRRIA
jgi:hypothetical protein